MSIVIGVINLTTIKKRELFGGNTIYISTPRGYIKNCEAIVRITDL